MGLISKIFGSDKVIKAGTDALDKVWYTDEEKAEGHIRLLKAYEAFKLAQRLLAMIVVPPWIAGLFICFVLTLFNIDVTEGMKILEGKLGISALTILAFYFGGGMFESINRK